MPIVHYFIGIGVDHVCKSDHSCTTYVSCSKSLDHEADLTAIIQVSKYTTKVNIDGGALLFEIKG